MMKLIPYSNLKPRNLGIILFVARLLAYAGYFFIGVALLAFSSEIYNYIFPIVPVGGQGETYHGDTYILGVITLVFAIVILTVSALFAALVSWEASLKSPNDREI
ncbi:conserved protein of unknown function [Alteromonas macleodii]|uniref:Uncharacterized protein n=1 Tax=Alteromonas macleodii TaxID=28108 RepID=A0A6T9Y4B7_ALTMA|nr:conserved protein of unknown function [Alteromonas macleodii]